MIIIDPGFPLSHKFLRVFEQLKGMHVREVTRAENVHQGWTLACLTHKQYLCTAALMYVTGQIWLQLDIDLI